MARERADGRAEEEKEADVETRLQRRDCRRRDVTDALENRIELKCDIVMENFHVYRCNSLPVYFILFSLPVFVCVFFLFFSFSHQ